MPAETADVVAIELIGNLDQFDRTVKQSATDFGQDMNRIKASADGAEKAVTRSMTRAARSAGAMQQATRNLGFQISDIGTQLSAGTSPFLVLAQQGPQVANALDGASGAVGRFATFLSGPWGAAILAATSILGVLLAKHVDFGNALDDEIEKLKENADKTKTAERAQDAFSNTIEGVSQALAENKEALEKLGLAQDTSAEAALREAEAQRVKAIRIREATIALIEQAKVAAEAAASAAQFAGVGGDAAAFGARRAQEEVARLEDVLKTAEQQLAISRAQVVEARSHVVVERAMRSEVEKINDRYDTQVDAARRAAVASGTVESALRKEIDAINDARKAELERERERTRSSRQAATLSPVTRQEVAQAIGAPIISGFRTPAENARVRGSRTSHHLGDNRAAVQAIDIPLTINGRPLTKAAIRSMLEPLGIEIKELLGPGDKDHDDHFHVAFARRRLGDDQIAENQQRLAEELEQRRIAEERRRQAFENELAGALDDEIAARQALITSAEEIARLELEAIEVSRARYADNLASLVEQKKLTDEEAAQLAAINDERAKLRVELVQRREDERKFRMAEAELRRQAMFESEERALAAELLNGQADLARTQAERRDLERRLLDLQYAEERARNDYLISYYDRLKVQEGISESELAEAEAQAEIAALRNESLAQRQANDEAQSDRRTAGPLESFFGDIPSEAGEINEALESVAAGGLATFTDALTDAIVNFRSLGDVGRAVLQNITAALVRLAIQQLLLKTIGATIGQAATASSGAAAAASAAAWAPAAAMASLATLGANAGPAAIALASTNALAQGLAVAGGALGRADGGPIFGRGGPREDNILVAASNGEYMIRAAAARKLGRAALDRMNLTGELPQGFASGGGIGGRAISPSNATAARGGGGGRASLSEESVNRLGQIVREAAGAMPDVNLFPTLDPGAAMRAALAHPGGQRALFDFIGENSGRFRTAVNS